jgi:signal transduction histidine kinase
VDLSRRVIVSKSRNLGQQALPVHASTLEKAASGQRFYETLTVDGVAIRLYNVPLLLDGQLVGLLQVGSPLSNVKQSLQNLRWALIFGGLLMVTLTGAVGWWMANKALRPIEQIAQVAAEIQEGEDLARRIQRPPIRDELGHLVDTLNSMLERLEAAYRNLAATHQFQRRFISDVSHELRTPLTTIKGNLDLLYRMRTASGRDNGGAGLSGQKTDGGRSGSGLMADDELEMLHDVRTEVDRMIRLIQDLLTLAQADTGVGLTLERVQVGDWLPQSLRLAERLPRSDAVEYEVQIDSDVLARTQWASADALQQLVYILLENAFKYTPRGKVAVTAREADGGLELTVEDTGIGMPPEVMAHIFERFYRGDPARSTPGTGLGLAIAEHIIHAHQGKVDVASREGEGSRFRVWLPLEPRPCQPPAGGL